MNYTHFVILVGDKKKVILKYKTSERYYQLGAIYRPIGKEQRNEQERETRIKETQTCLRLIKYFIILVAIQIAKVFFVLFMSADREKKRESVYSLY